MTSDSVPLLSSYIDGAYKSACQQNLFTCRNPANQQILCDVEIAGTSEIDQAVAAAAKASKEWSALPPAERTKVLWRAADLLEQRNDALAELEVAYTGKPISEARSVDIASGVEALRYFAGLAPSITGEHHQLGSNFAYTRREPLGVVAGIGAWNYPLQIACWKAAPALAAGNAMVFKPSEYTPLTALKLAEVFMEAGAPAGLFNVVLGDGSSAEKLIAAPEVRKVSLTGSVATGKKVMMAAAAGLKQVTFELGGKSPLIIFEDAHLDNAVKAALLANFYTQGEICSNGTRVFVHDSIYDRFVEKLVAATEQLRIGDPMDPATEVGSLIHKDHQKRVLDYIASGQQQGAKLLTGGKAHGEDGCFVEPTIFGDCRDDMTIVQEEIFGPVMSLLRFSQESEVVSRANNHPMGLAAGVFTQNLNRGHRVVAALEAGTCWLNTYNITPVEIPFGGYKQSGMGRENSAHALEHYTQLKTVYVEMGDLQ